MMLALLAVLAGVLAPPTLTDTPVVTSGGTVAWWGNTYGKDVALTVWRPGGGAPRTIPGVKPGPVGRMDLDLGPGPKGHTWATYTHCLPGGCDPWAVDLATGAQRDLGVGRGRAAAIWHRIVVFARGGKLYRGRIGEPTSVRRVPMPRGEDVEQVDLRGGRIAYVTWESGGDSRQQALWLSGRDGPAPRRPVDAGFSGEECTLLMRSPTLTARGLTHLRAGSGAAEVCGRGSRTTLVTPSGSRAVPVGALGAVLAGGRTVVLAPPAAKARREDRDLCRPGRHFGCEIRTE
jgi:hypothetical protein